MLNKLQIFRVVFILAGAVLLSPSSHAAKLDISNAEVIVKSSANTAFVAMTNTDATGRFSLKNIPAGGINVVIRRKNKIIAQGATIFAGGNLSETQVSNILAAPASNTLKAGPGK